MAKKRLWLLVLALCVFLSGCSLAQPEDESSQGEDALVGVMVTTQPLDLFDMESFVEDNVDVLFRGGAVSQSDAARYQNSLFAVWDEAERRYVFPETEGYLLLNTRQQDEQHGEYENVQTSEVFCGTSTHLTYTDEEARHEFATTIYMEAVSGAYCQVYVNPIYQTADGRVYAQSGSGVSTNTDDGSRVSMAKTLAQTKQETRNGSTQSRTFRLELTIQLTPAPTGAEVFWMTADDGVLRQEHYAPGAFPTELDAQDAEFLLVVERFADGSSTGSIFNAASTDSPGAMYPGEEGFLIRQSCSVTW